MPRDILLAAAVEVDITPPVGAGFDGYSARQGNSIGVHDPLLAQLLLLRSGDQGAVLISMDLLGVGLDLTGRVRAGIERAVGVPGRCVMLACTHTHSGAAGFLPPSPGIHRQPDEELQDVTVRKLVGAAIWAQQTLQPARLGLGRGRVEGLGRNRNDPEKGLADHEVLVLRVDDREGIPLCVMMNYGCHPTVLGYQNLLFSADFPGAARATLRCIYPKTVCMYSNGASGDVSTRFTRRDQSFAEVERMGRMLGGEVLKVMQSIATHDSSALGGELGEVQLKFRPFPSAEAAQREVVRLRAELENLKATGAAHGDIRRAHTRVEGAEGQALMSEELAGQTQRISQVQLLRVGDLALLGLPGEPFSRTVLEIKQQSPCPWTAVVSYANEDAGYFPDAVSIADGTYEALISPYGADVAEELRRIALHLLGKG